MTSPLNAENARIEALSRLMSAAQQLSSSTDIDELLAKIVHACIDVTQSENASILLLDEDRNELYFRKAQGEHGELLQTLRLPVNEQSAAGWCALHRTSLVIQDTRQDQRHFKGVDALTAFETRSLLAVPIIWGDRLFGVVEALNRTSGSYSETDAEYLGMLATQAAVALNNVRVMDQLQNFFVHMVEVVTTALELIDPSSRGHVHRVARLATGLAKELQLPPKELEQVLYAAYFHEIGRLFNESAHTGVRDNNEPVLGAQLLEKIKLLQKIAPLVRHHRERWDGTGRPDGLKGDQTPLGARILGLAVDYDEAQLKNAGHIPLHEFQAVYFTQAPERHDPHLVSLFRRVVGFPERTVPWA